MADRETPSETLALATEARAHVEVDWVGYGQLTMLAESNMVAPRIIVIWLSKCIWVQAYNKENVNANYCRSLFVHCHT